MIKFDPDAELLDLSGQFLLIEVALLQDDVIELWHDLNHLLNLTELLAVAVIVRLVICSQAPEQLHLLQKNLVIEELVDVQVVDELFIKHLLTLGLCEHHFRMRMSFEL